VRVVNDPASLLKYNEKLYATHFPEFCPAYIVTASLGALRDFRQEHGAIIVKPLDAMGGQGVFLVEENSVNFEVIWELQTNRGTYPVMAQAFLPEIAEGDKRIIVIGGAPFDHALVRLPKAGSIRGNLAHGGGHQVRKLTEAERNIAETVGRRLVQDGVEFAGLDVIGDRLIEVNITSPTGIRQLAQETGENLGLRIMKRIMQAS
jgi:glutathione synthase